MLLAAILRDTPLVFSLLVLAVIAWCLSESDRRKKLVRWLPHLIALAIAFKLLWSALLTFLQWRAWLAHEFSRFLLPPHQPFGYFMGYGWTRFWFASVLALAVVLVVALVGLVLRHYRPSAFTTNEVWLWAIFTALVDWPKTLLFVPLAFGLTLFWFLWLFIQRGQRELKPLHISYAGALSTAILLLSGQFFVELFRLQVLQVGWI